MRNVITPVAGSALALSVLELHDESAVAVGGPEHDSLLFAFAGSGSLSLGGASFPVALGTAVLVLAGEEAALTGRGLGLVRATVGPDAERHAPLGARETIARLDPARTEQALGSRAFQILLGPHNGSTRATLFAGFLPPGRSPWHYHLYDEIVWIPEGPGRVHRPGSDERLDAGSAFRLRPRAVHTVENSSPDREMTVIGVFTPAGSPAAAYLPDRYSPDEPPAGEYV